LEAWSRGHVVVLIVDQPVVQRASDGCRSGTTEINEDAVARQ
jgi:hypothetical protein